MEIILQWAIKVRRFLKYFCEKQKKTKFLIGIQLGPAMENSRYPPSYYNGNVLIYFGTFFSLWNVTQGCAFTHDFSFSTSSESPMTSYGNSMPNYRYNPNYGSSYQTRAPDTMNYAYGSPRSNYGYPSGQRYEPRPQSTRDIHPHYYSERNVMSFK